MENNIIEFPKIKKYLYIKDIGQGATGQTKLIKDETINEVFVCKKYSTCHPMYQQMYYENFVNEIKILYKINHPNIVRVFTYYLYPEQCTGYILMEYIEGTNITQYITNNPNKINDIFIQVIEGFCYLEGLKILHRDIRPSNLLVTHDGIVKIIDFGFGKSIKDGADFEKSITLNWICSSPNDFKLEIYDFKTEIYFIGRLFENIINNNSLHSVFKYHAILEKMIAVERDYRIESFSEISREIILEKNTYIDFNDTEKQIYTEFADLFMSVCIAVDSTTKYIQNVEIITNRLNNLIQKSALEEYIQDNRLFISCFISPFYRYNKKTIVPVEKLQFFFNWWEKLSLERKRIVLNNLWVRFDTINRRVINDLPF